MRLKPRAVGRKKGCLTPIGAHPPSRSLPAALRERPFALVQGNNEKGQLGDGTTTNRVQPTPVNSLVSFKKLAIGTYSSHTCAISTSDVAYCWGAHRVVLQLRPGPVVCAVPPCGLPRATGSSRA